MANGRRAWAKRFSRRSFIQPNKEALAEQNARTQFNSEASLQARHMRETHGDEVLKTSFSIIFKDDREAEELRTRIYKLIDTPQFTDVSDCILDFLNNTDNKSLKKRVVDLINSLKPKLTGKPVVKVIDEKTGKESWVLDEEEYDRRFRVWLTIRSLREKLNSPKFTSITLTPNSRTRKEYLVFRHGAEHSRHDYYVYAFNTTTMVLRRSFRFSSREMLMNYYRQDFIRWQMIEQLSEDQVAEYGL